MLSTPLRKIYLHYSLGSSVSVRNMNAIMCQSVAQCQGSGLRRLSRSSLTQRQTLQTCTRRSSSSVTFAHLTSSSPSSSSSSQSSGDYVGVANVEPASWTLRKGKMVRDGTVDPIYVVGDDYESGGPIELPPREIEIDPFAVPEASPAQIVASICLTGAIAVLSYRALRRRATRSKEMQFRSSGIKATPKSIKEEARKTALDNLMKAPEVPTPPPSAAQTAFGAIVAGVIALGLYKFTSSVEAGFSVKAVSQDYSIRNLTITVRTIITGLCYLATFVFAANSIGLTLYAFQLLLGIGIPDPVPPSDFDEKEEASTREKLEAEDFSDK